MHDYVCLNVPVWLQIFILCWFPYTCLYTCVFTYSYLCTYYVNIYLNVCVFVCFHVYVVLIIHKLMKYFEKYIYLRNLYMLNYNMSILHTSISTFKKTCLEIISFEISLKQIKSFNFLTVFSCNPLNSTIWPWYLISLFSDYTFASFSSFSFLWHISLNAVCYNQNLKKI